MIPALRSIGVLFFALAAGCAGGAKEAPPGAMAQAAPPIVAPPHAEPKPDVLPAQEVLPRQAPSAAAEPLVPAAKEEATVAPMPAPKSRSTAKAVLPPKSEAPPSLPANLEPPLDVAALKARLRETSAIGLFTKLALKNQMDDLLKQFRAHYQDGHLPSLASLRQPYDMLLLKVLAVVQDGDPSLARTISESREAIWGILADPEKFNAAT